MTRTQAERFRAKIESALKVYTISPILLMNSFKYGLEVNLLFFKQVRK